MDTLSPSHLAVDNTLRGAGVGAGVTDGTAEGVAVISGVGDTVGVAVTVATGVEVAAVPCSARAAGTATSNNRQNSVMLRKPETIFLKRRLATLIPSVRQVNGSGCPPGLNSRRPSVWLFLALNKTFTEINFLMCET
jgi:hypothetical protein